MAPGFSTHNPTAHLQADHDHGEDCCGVPKIDVPTPSIDDQIKLYPLSVDPSGFKVSLSTKTGNPPKGAEAMLLDETLATVNHHAQYLIQSPFPHCPPPPQMVQNNPRSQQINRIKEEGNTAFKAGNFTRAVELYTAAAEAAANRPMFESAGWVREELSVALCNRAAAYSSLKMWVEALCDAEAVIKLKRNWSKGHFRKAKALQGLGKMEEARDATLLGLEFEPDNTDLRAVLGELGPTVTRSTAN